MEGSEAAHTDEAMSGDVAERVRSIVAAAEQAAAAIRADAERQAAARLKELEAATSGYVAEARRSVEEHAEERKAHITELSERLRAGTEELLAHAGEANELRRKLDDALAALAQAAARLSREASIGWRDRAPRPATAPARAAEPPAVRDPAPDAEERGRRPFPRLSLHRHADRTSRPEPETVQGERPDETRLDMARLIALQMAVAGSERPEVEQHLRDSFHLEDPGPVLDAVFDEPTPGPRR